MKKILATALAVVMILSTLACLAIIPAGAEDATGDWIAYTNAGSYQKDENGNYDYTTIPDRKAPSYSYTDEGFHASYTASSEYGTSQKINIMSKDKVNLKDGFEMTVRVDEFKYYGDCWFSFAIWDSPCVAQGVPANDPNFAGNGLWSLLRPQILGTQMRGWSACQSFVTDKLYYDGINTNGVKVWGGTYDGGSATNPAYNNVFQLGNNQTDPDNWIGTEGKKPTTEVIDGKTVTTLKITLTWDAETGYRLFYGGVEEGNTGIEVTQAVVNDYLNYRFPDGMAYIGFSVHGAGTDCTTSVTVLDFNGETPTGSDISDGVGVDEKIGAMKDSATIPEGQPALLFNTANAKEEYKTTGKFSNFTALKYTTNKDGTFTIMPEKTNASWVQMIPKKSESYEASDFPYIAIMLRNFCNCVYEPGQTRSDCSGEGELLNAYYLAGDRYSADDTHQFTEEANTDHWKDTATNDHNDYKLYIINMSADADFPYPDWSGRINGLQLVFNNIVMSNEGQNKFDFCYMGYFRTEDEAWSYGEAYIAALPDACAHENTTETAEIPAACDALGQTAGESCDDCGHVITPVTPIPALGHNMVDVEATDATCAAPGYSAGKKCDREGCTYREQTEYDALGHGYVANQYESDENGHWQVCYRCQEKTEAVAHTLNGIVCSVCGYGCDHAETKVETVAATCSAEGQEKTICKECGTVVTSKILEKLPHTVVAIGEGWDATCTEAGKTAGEKCSVCQLVIKDQTTINPKPHTAEVIPAVEATCAAAGATAGEKCSECGMTMKAPEAIEQLAHTLEPVGEAKAPTCTEKGLTAGEKCTKCDYVVEQAEVAATGHTYENGKCTVCNAEQPTEAPTKKPEEKPTEKPNGSDKNEGNKNEGGDKGEEEKKGCKSVAGLSALAICATVSLAGAMCFKKKR